MAHDDHIKWRFRDQVRQVFRCAIIDANTPCLRILSCEWGGFDPDNLETAIAEPGQQRSITASQVADLRGKIVRNAFNDQVIQYVTPIKAPGEMKFHTVEK
jgi:hypothetical protein